MAGFWRWGVSKRTEEGLGWLDKAGYSGVGAEGEVGKED